MGTSWGAFHSLLFRGCGVFRSLRSLLFRVPGVFRRFFQAVAVQQNSTQPSYAWNDVGGGGAAELDATLVRVE